MSAIKFFFGALLVLDTIAMVLISISIGLSIKKQMREKQAEQSDQQ